MRRLLAASALIAIAACSQPAPRAEAPAPQLAAIGVETPLKVDAPAGRYTTDPAHSTLIFKINHMGYSMFTGRFTKFDAALELTIDPKSIAADNAPAGFMAHLYGPDWLDAKAHPAITYKSTNVTLTGQDTADVTGDFTLHGVSKPVVLHVKFNGGYPGMVYDPHARIGFSAHGTLKRSEFEMAAFILQPGSNIGVGDEISVAIETEMSGPAWKADANAAPATTTGG
jgi:polyisoprenoid-binding protein YceI